jgi:hypothetical protein
MWVPGKRSSNFVKPASIWARRRRGHVFCIQKDKVKLTVLSDQGKEAVIAIPERGQFFGEGCLSGQRLRIATTTAMQDCLITAITKPAMIAALQDEPKFSELFMAFLLSRNSRIEADLIDQLFNSSERRLARLLLLLANFGKEGESPPNWWTPVVGSKSQEVSINSEEVQGPATRGAFCSERRRFLGLSSSVS